jgi:hypothetical protein
MSKDGKIVRILELLAYLASSARGLLDEPREYGPLRCLDAMRRLIEFSLETGLVEDPEVARYFEELKGKLSRGIVTLMYSAEEFKKFVIEINTELAGKAASILEKYYAESGE